MNEQKQNQPVEPEIEIKGESMSFKPLGIAICDTHTKDNWTTHKGYVDNLDGTISCKFCPWGTMMPGFYRVVNDVVLDLRSVSRDQ